MYRQAFPRAFMLVMTLLAAYLTFVFFSNLFDDNFSFFNIFMMTTSLIGIGGFVVALLECFKGAYVFEENELVIKSILGTKRIAYGQIRHVVTSKPGGLMRFLAGMKDVNIELDLGKANPRVINSNNQEEFLQELNERRKGVAANV